MTASVSPTGEGYKIQALDLIRQAQEDYEELKAVPIEGITIFFTGEERIGNHVNYDDDSGEGDGIFKSQTRRRDELGKSIMGRYAQAQIFATLYAAECTLAAAPTQRLY